MKQRKFKELMRFLPTKFSIETIKQYCVDLTYLADKGYLNTTYCKTDVMKKMIVALCRRVKSNVMLIGDPGVGKTAIVENLAYKIARKEVSLALMNKKIISLDFPKLMSGARYRGDLEERLDMIITEIQKSNCLILFIDEIHNILNSQNSQTNNLDIANILKPFLARGDFQCIGATTKNEYLNFIANKDIAFARRFQNIYIEEPSKEEVFLLLKTIKSDYENYHFIKYPDNILELSINLCEKFILTKKMPDSVLETIDNAGSYVTNLMKNKNPHLVHRLISEVTILKDCLIKSLNQVDVDKAEYYSRKISQKEEILNGQLLSLQLDKKYVTISKNDLLISFIESTGFKFLKFINKQNILKLEVKIKNKLLFQEHVVKRVCTHFQEVFLLSYKKKGLGNLLFLGPSGVGKTFLAEILYEEFFEKEIKFIQINCAKYFDGNDNDTTMLLKSIYSQPIGILHFYNLSPTNVFMINFINKFIFTDVNSTEYTNNQSNILLKIFEINMESKELISSCGFGNGNSSLSQYFDICNDFQWKDNDILFQKMLKFFKIDFLQNIDCFCVFNILSSEIIERIFMNLLKIKIEEIENKYGVKCIYDKKIIKVLQEKYMLYEKSGAKFIKKIIKEDIIGPFEDLLIKNEKTNVTKIFKIIFDSKLLKFNFVEISKMDN